MFSLSSDLSVINILINLEVSELTNESCSNQFIFIQKLLQNLLSALDSKMPSLITFLLIFRSSQLHFQVQVSVRVFGVTQVDIGLFKINYCRIPVVAKPWSPQVNLYREGAVREGEVFR